MKINHPMLQKILAEKGLFVVKPSIEKLEELCLACQDEAIKDYIGDEVSSPTDEKWLPSWLKEVEVNKTYKPLSPVCNKCLLIFMRGKRAWRKFLRKYANLI